MDVFVLNFTIEETEAWEMRKLGQDIEFEFQKPASIDLYCLRTEGQAGKAGEMLHVLWLHAPCSPSLIPKSYLFCFLGKLPVALNHKNRICGS